MREVAIKFGIAGTTWEVDCGQWGEGLKWFARASVPGYEGDLETWGCNSRGEALDTLIEMVEAFMNGEEAPDDGGATGTQVECAA